MLARIVVMILATTAMTIAAPPPRAEAVVCGYAGCTFDLSTAMGGKTLTQHRGGQATARGEIIFAGTDWPGTANDSSTVTVDVHRIADICSNGAGTGDGLGAYMLVEAILDNGGRDLIQRMPTPFKDADGCSNGSVGAARRTYAFRVRIKQVRVYLLECSGQCYDEKWGQWKENPLRYP